jgi:hypothetical protein
MRTRAVTGPQLTRASTVGVPVAERADHRHPARHGDSECGTRLGLPWWFSRGNLDGLTRVAARAAVMTTGGS